MQTETFHSKPFFVEGVHVTEENMKEVATWCGGTIISHPRGSFIKVFVHRPLFDRQTKAFAGDWVLYGTSGFKVYTNRAFEKGFIPVPSPSTVIINTPSEEVKS